MDGVFDGTMSGDAAKTEFYTELSETLLWLFRFVIRLFGKLRTYCLQADSKMSTSISNLEMQ